jgi:hypothetical protein
MSSPSPYRPPQAPVADQDRPRGSPVKGMAFGLMVDIGGTLCASYALMFIWAIRLAAQGHDAKAIEEMLNQQFADSTSDVGIAANVLGMAFSWLGGYVCARVARETELRCAGVVAGLGIGLALLLGGDAMTALHFGLVLLGAAIVMLGAWMGAQRNARQP